MKKGKILAVALALLFLMQCLPIYAGDVVILPVDNFGNNDETNKPNYDINNDKIVNILDILLLLKNPENYKDININDEYIKNMITAILKSEK